MMTIEERARLARIHAYCASVSPLSDDHTAWNAVESNILGHLRKAVAEEREACAKVCDAVAASWSHHNIAPMSAQTAAKAIRKRGSDET